MSSRRRPLALAVVLAGAVVAGGLVAPIGAAAAGVAAPSGCVTKREFRQVDEGDLKRTVQEVFGTRGRAGDGGAGGFDRLYPQCAPAIAAAQECEVKVEYVVGRRGAARLESKRYNGLCGARRA